MKKERRQAFPSYVILIFRGSDRFLSDLRDVYKRQLLELLKYQFFEYAALLYFDKLIF